MSILHRTVHSVASLQVSERDRVVSFLRDKCVIRGQDEMLTSSTGRPLKWLLDTRTALLNPEMSQMIAAMFWPSVKRLYPCQLCCIELSGIPLMIALQAYALGLGVSLNGVIIRKERKPTGRQRQLEGELNELPLILVDDILHSGDSVERVAIALRAHDRQLGHVLTLVDFGISTTMERLVCNGVSLTSLISMNELGLYSSPPEPSTMVRRDIFTALWRYDGETKRSVDIVPKSRPVIDSDKVYAGFDNGCFCACDRWTGTLSWRFRTGATGTKGIRSSPLIQNRVVYFGAYDGVIYALHTETGQELWRYSAADWVGSSPCCSPRLNCLYIGVEYALPRTRGGLVALDLSTGDLRWEYQISSLVHSSPLFLDKLNVVIVGSNDGLLHCVDAASGLCRWSARTAGAIKARPHYDRERHIVLVGSFDNAVYAFDAETGHARWVVHTDGAVYSEPVVVGQSVYVASTDKHLYSIDTDEGSVIQKLYLGAKLYGTPTCSLDKLYCASTGGIIYEITTDTGTIVGTHSFEERVTNELVWDGASIFYVMTTNGSLIGMTYRA